MTSFHPLNIDQITILKILDWQVQIVFHLLLSLVTHQVLIQTFQNIKISKRGQVVFENPKLPAFGNMVTSIAIILTVIWQLIKEFLKVY